MKTRLHNLYKSMRKTITVDQNNIELILKQFSEQFISVLAEFGDMSVDSESLLLSKFEHQPSYRLWLQQIILERSEGGSREGCRVC